MIEGGTNHIFVDDSVLVNVNEPEIAGIFKLFQNYPNPVTSTTTISYQLQVSSLVIIKIYDFQGREVMTLVNEYQDAGLHTSELNLSNLQNGVYFYRMEAGQFNDIKKLTIIK
jgi:hypothetical protein